jgi:hypothetical protein
MKTRKPHECKRACKYAGMCDGSTMRTYGVCPGWVITEKFKKVTANVVPLTPKSMQVPLPVIETGRTGRTMFWRANK